jgi:hypothetical protein
MASTVNEAFYTDSNCYQEAGGFQWRVASHDRSPILRSVPDPAARGGFYYERNGGINFQRRVLLSDDTALIRFVRAEGHYGKKRTTDELMNSPWWLTIDRFFLLLDRARTAGVPLVEMVRRQLAVPEEWSTCDTIIRARPKPGVTLAAFAGPGLTAIAGDERRIIAPEAKTLWMEQLYIPGLGRMPWLARRPPNVAVRWIDYERSFDATAKGFR